MKHTGHAQPVLHTANALDHIVECMVNASNALHTPCAKFARDTHSNHAVLLILHAQFVERIINVYIVTDTLMALVHHADAPHLIHIIVIVPTIIK